MHTCGLKEYCYCFSVTKLCPTLCNPRNCSMPGFPVLHFLPAFAQTHVHWVSDAIHPSYPLSPPSPLALNLSQHQVFFKESASSGQSIGASASASVLPMNIQGWFPLGLNGLISMLSKGLSRIFSKLHSLKPSIPLLSAFFMVHLSHPYLTTRKTIAL